MLQRNDNIILDKSLEEMLAQWKQQQEAPRWVCRMLARWIVGKKLSFDNYNVFARWASATAWLICTHFADIYCADGRNGWCPFRNE